MLLKALLIPEEHRKIIYIKRKKKTTHGILGRMKRAKQLTVSF